jgi:integrase/recombinase XerD
MKRMEPMTQSHVESLRKTANESGPRAAAIVALLTRHFIRASELAGTDAEGNLTGIKTKDVDLTAGTIRINRLKGSETFVDRLTSVEAEVLARWIATKPTSIWLFPGRNSEEPMDRRTVYNIFHGLALKAGIPMTMAAPHSSRHTLGQSMAEQGAHAKVIQQAAGHKSLASSGRYYEFRRAHIDAERARFLGEAL